MLLWGCANSLTVDQNELFKQWKEAPEALRITLEQEPDDLKKLHQITLLSEEFPGQTLSLCPLLPNQRDHERCKQLNARPASARTQRAIPHEPANCTFVECTPTVSNNIAGEAKASVCTWMIAR